MIAPVPKPVPISTYIDKKEEPVVEEKPKEEIDTKEEVEKKEMPERRVSEEIITEEKAPEKKISEEKMPVKRISEERKEERIEKIIVEKRDEAVQTDDDIGESSSDSVYSYSMYIIYLFYIIFLLRTHAFKCLRFIVRISKDSY